MYFFFLQFFFLLSLDLLSRHLTEFYIKDICSYSFFSFIGGFYDNHVKILLTSV